MKAMEGPREEREKDLLQKGVEASLIEATGRLPAQHDILYHGDGGVSGAVIWSSYSLGTIGTQSQIQAGVHENAVYSHAPIHITIDYPNKNSDNFINLSQKSNLAGTRTTSTSPPGSI